MQSRFVTKTAQLINEINPEFARIRRLWLYQSETSYAGPECPLWQEIRSGNFIPQTPEGTVLELKTFLESLKDISTYITCDHANNYVRVAGQMMQDRDAMLAQVNEFLALPQETKEAHYRAIGSQI